MNPKDNLKTNASSSFHLVKEDDSCRFWEYSGDASLLPMRECWYCKYSDFRKKHGEHKTLSVCHCPQNVIENDIAQ